MPKCVLCDSQAFDVLDGLYFCTQCGTQSQDAREEVDDHEEPVNIRLQVKQKGGRGRKEFDCGKPWFTVEGFQVLLKAQVEYLIKIGVDTKLKDVIGQMWFRYVQLTTNIFTTTKDGQTRILNYSQVKRKRDDLKDFVPFDSIHRPSPKVMTSSKLDEGDALELSSEIAREDFYEDDDPTRTLFDNEDQDSDGDSDSDSSFIGSVSINTRKTKGSIGYMTMTHTLAFCYLGLLWLHEPICISDLIRWARDGHFPYFDASSYFPSHMKFSYADVTAFSARVIPSKRKIYRRATALKSFLCLPDISRQNIELYIARYVIDLQLPACIHRCVNALVKMAGTNANKINLIPNYDDLAMAHIILSLKLIYGLDGRTECDLAKVITENPPDENRSYFPAWSDILDSIYTCQTARVEQGVPWTKDELGLLKDCRNYSQFCREKIFGSWKPPPTVRRNNVHLKGFKGLKSEKQVEYAQMFDTLLKDGASEMPFAMKVASSFPLLCGKRELLRKHESEKVPIRHTGSPDGLGQGKHGKSPRKAVDDQNPEYPILHNLLKLAKQRGVSCEKVSMFYQNMKEEPVSTTESTSNDIHSDTQANERSRSSSIDSESSQSERRSQFVHYSFPECYFTRKSPLLCSQLWKEAVIPNSLRRLVELCSRIVETEPAVLFTAVEKLERNLFDETNE